MILLKNCSLYDGIRDTLPKKSVIINKDIIETIIPAETPVEETNFSRVIDTSGLITSPGFIDIHSHADLNIFNKTLPNPKLMQGVTTEVIGNCGLSVYPVRKQYLREWYTLYKTVWGENPGVNLDSLAGFDGYINTVRQLTIPVNIVPLIGLGALRLEAGGFSKTVPDADCSARLIDLLTHYLEKGIAGISTGSYPPNSFITEPLFTEICRCIQKHNRFIVHHLDDEGDGVFDALEKVHQQLRTTGCRGHISHFKSYGKRNWDKNSRLLETLDTINHEGFELTFDSYPYTAGSTTLNAVLPPYVQEHGLDNMLSELENTGVCRQIENDIAAGMPGWENYANLVGWDNIMVSGLSQPDTTLFEGKFLSEIAADLKTTPAQAAISIIKKEHGCVSMVMFAMNEDNIKDMMRHPRQMVGSDGLYYGKPHPRTYGTFARILGKYCREENTLSLPQALKKITAAPAAKLGLTNRGTLQKGSAADITIFDPAAITDTATYKEPQQYPRGIQYVFCNGTLSVENDTCKKKYSGRVLMKKRI